LFDSCGNFKPQKLRNQLSNTTQRDPTRPTTELHSAMSFLLNRRVEHQWNCGEYRPKGMRLNAVPSVTLEFIPREELLLRIKEKKNEIVSGG
jgi:hypothetical protein